MALQNDILGRNYPFLNFSISSTIAMFFPMRLIIFSILILLSTTSCTNLFFFPEKTLVIHPTDIGLEYRDTYYNIDGTKLHAWWIPATIPTQGTILVLHGNAENISTHIGSVNWLPAEGYNLLLLDYRGYGLSEGTPSLSNIYQDTKRVIGSLSDEQNLILYGQSIGASLALRLATEPKVKCAIRAVIAESPFSSYRRIAREKIGQFWITWPLSYPLSVLFSDKLNPLDTIEEVSPLPLLLIHSKNDEIIPFEHSERLFEKAQPPIAFTKLQNTGHVGAYKNLEARKTILGFMKLALASKRIDECEIK